MRRLTRGCLLQLGLVAGLVLAGGGVATVQAAPAIPAGAAVMDAAVRPVQYYVGPGYYGGPLIYGHRYYPHRYFYGRPGYYGGRRFYGRGYGRGGGFHGGRGGFHR